MPAPLTPRVLGRLRLAAQGLLGNGLPTVPDAVRWMTAMQAQDLGAALWALGQRVPACGWLPKACWVTAFRPSPMPSVG